MKYVLTPILLALSIALILPAQQKTSGPPPPTGKKAEEQRFIPPPSIYGEENLHSLAIKDSNLHAATPLAGETDKYPDFTRELLEVQWRDNDPIDLYVIKPTGVVKPPVVLYLYSYPSETDRFRDNEYCKRLTANGYAAIGFVSALNGHRYHDRPMKEWFISELPAALAMSVHDVQMVLRYLAERGDVDVGHAGIFGAGSGATIAVLAASVDPQLRAVDALQPWGDWPTWLAKSSLIPENERPNYLKPAFLASVEPFDPVQWFGRVQTKALRLQFVLDDPITPAAAIQHMTAAVPSSAQLLEYPTKRQQYEILRGGRAFDWIKDQLHAPESQPVSTQANNNNERKAQNERTQ